MRKPLAILALLIAAAACAPLRDNGAGTAAADTNVPSSTHQPLDHDPKGKFGPPGGR